MFTDQAPTYFPLKKRSLQVLGPEPDFLKDFENFCKEVCEDGSPSDVSCPSNLTYTVLQTTPLAKEFQIFKSLIITGGDRGVIVSIAGFPDWGFSPILGFFLTEK